MSCPLNINVLEESNTTPGSDKVTGDPQVNPVAPIVANMARIAADVTARIERTRRFAKQYMEECGFKLCAIAKGSKGPKSEGWQNKPLVGNMIGDHGLGLIHALSGTCAIDLDDLQAADAWLGARGIELRDLLADDDAVQIVSGRENRSKLLYRLPEGIEPMVTKQVTHNGKMILEFRCASSRGTGCQDVLPPTIHPKTGTEYQWAGAGNFTNLPVLPSVLLQVWNDQAMPCNSLAVVPQAAVQMIAEGSRNKTLFQKAGDMIGSGMAEESVLAALLRENEIKCSEPLPPSEVKAIVRSAMKSSQGAIRLAQENALDAARRAALDVNLKVHSTPTVLADFIAKLPPVMQEIAEWYQKRAFCYQEAFVLPIALASCGAVLARDFASENRTSTNMYWVLLAPTATGKEAALNCVNEVVAAYGDSRRAGAPSSHSGVLAALERNPASCYVIDELGEFLKGVFDPKAAGYKAATGAVLMDLYTKGGTDYLGQEYAKQTGPDARKRADIDSPCPSIFGVTTPSTFFGAFGAGAIDSGFLPRLMPFRAPDLVPMPNFDQKSEPVPVAVHEWQAAVKARVQLRREELEGGGNLRSIQSHSPIQVPFSAEALELRNAYMLAIRDRRNSGIDGLTSSMLSRIVENSARIALTLAVAADPQVTEVSAPQLQLALDIVSYATDMFSADIRKNLFDSKFAELESKVMDCIIKYFVEKGCGIPEKSLVDRSRPYGNATLGQRKEVIGALMGQGKVTRSKTRQNTWRYTPTADAF